MNNRRTTYVLALGILVLVVVLWVSSLYYISQQPLSPSRQIDSNTLNFREYWRTFQVCIDGDPDGMSEQ